MSDFYSGLAAVATNLLTDKGQAVTINRETSTSFDPVTGIDTVTPSSFSGVGAVFDYHRSEIDGNLIQKGDIRLLLNAVTTEPLTDDEITIDGETYRVISVKPTSPGGTVVMYELQLRK